MYQYFLFAAYSKNVLRFDKKLQVAPSLITALKQNCVERARAHAQYTDEPWRSLAFGLWVV